VSARISELNLLEFAENVLGIPLDSRQRECLIQADMQARKPAPAMACDPGHWGGLSADMVFPDTVTF
jgi:hypothetical protein